MADTVFAGLSVFFLKILNMSITAVWVILAVVLLRFLLKKAPRAIVCTLWVLVAVRLVCPVSLESNFSLIPNARLIDTDISNFADEKNMEAAALEDSRAENRPNVSDTGIPAIDEAIHSAITESMALDFTDSASKKASGNGILLSGLSVLWLCGMAGMLIFAGASYLRIRKRTAMSMPYGQRVLLCDGIDSPFILGMLRPRIYLPSSMNREEMGYVLAHERAHLRRGDHWWKPLAYLILSVHWFNPLCWLGYGLLCKDIELACDERVVKGLKFEEKKAYSRTLLNCGRTRRTSSACPLAFGEVSVKERVKNVLHYKKPALWMVLMAVVACLAAAGCLLTNPKTEVGRQEASEPENGPSVPDEGPRQTEESYISEDFFNHNWNYAGEERNPDKAMVNMCLTSLYDAPENVDLYELLYNGIGIAVEEADIRFLEEAGARLEYDVIKWPKAEIDRILKLYFNLTLEETSNPNLQEVFYNEVTGVYYQNFYYNEESDCYYLVHSDSNYPYIRVLEQKKNGNGDIEITYQKQNGPEGGLTDGAVRQVAVLREADGRYIFISNQELEKYEPVSSDVPASSDAPASENMTLSLSELCAMPVEESIRELQRFGLVLPKAYAADSKLAEEAMKTVLADLRAGQLTEGSVPYSYTELAALAKQVRSIVLKHAPRM